MAEGVRIVAVFWTLNLSKGYVAMAKKTSFNMYGGQTVLSMYYHEI